MPMTNARSSLPAEAERESVPRRPQQAPEQNNSVPPLSLSGDLSNYLTGVDVMSGVLSYAERTSPGISSRVSAGDFLALCTGLLHAAGLSAATRRVNVCPPAVVATVLTAAGAPSVNGGGAGAWQTVTRAKKVTKVSGKPAKTSNVGKKASSSSKEGNSSGPKKVKAKAETTSQPATDAAKARRKLLDSCLRSWKRLSRPEAKADLTKPGGVSNMRCANVSNVTKEQVTAKVNALSDDAIAKRDPNVAPLVFIGIIPKDSIEASLLKITKQARDVKGTLAGASINKVQKESTPEPKGKEVDRAQGKETSPPTAGNPLSSGIKLCARRIRPSFPSDSAKTDREKLSCILRGMAMEEEDGNPIPPGAADSDDLFSHYMGWFRSKGAPTIGKVVDPKCGAAAMCTSYKGVVMTSFVVMRKADPNAAFLIVTNAGGPSVPSKFLSMMKSDEYRTSGSMMNIYPYESPPRPTQGSLSRRMSDVVASGTPSTVQGQQASTDVFADLYTISAAKRGN